jgi:epoxyqueuosine reductase
VRALAPGGRAAAAAVFREEARRFGFVRVGIARAGTPPHFDVFRDWIGAGRQASMAYLSETAVVRGEPERLLPGARSIVCLAWKHAERAPVAADGSAVARYALGADYHGDLRRRALALAREAERRIGPFAWRICVDSTPLAERSFAAAAGLGWIGKNGCLIDPEQGSWLLLAEILTDLDLPEDSPIAEQCGSCVRCLTACPTGAFVQPGLLDAARCLAYWTIEHRGPLPDAVKEALGPHVFGCDICQEVCPYNGPVPSASAEATADTAPSAEAPAGAQEEIPTRREWLEMGRGVWRKRFGATAFNRAHRRGIQRNAAASAGAVQDAACLPALPAIALLSDRGASDAARWASGRLGLLPR